MNAADTTNSPLMWTVQRGSRAPRTEAALPGTRIFTPTSLLYDLLAWIDDGKTWSDIDPVMRRDVATDLRALANMIEPDSPSDMFDEHGDSRGCAE